MMIALLFKCIIYSYLIQSCLGIALPPAKVAVLRKSKHSDPLATVPCDFENGLCPGYEVDKNSKLQWLLQQGPTSSQFTGPFHDKTVGKGGNGWYVYIESSNQLNGREARIQTAMLDHTKTQGNKLCLSFHYHMLGHTMGEFTVHVNVPGDSLETKHFHLKGNQKQSDWQLGRFAFDTPNKPFKIVFRGTTSFSYFGDIGLDEINISEINAGQTCDFWPTKASASKASAPKPLPTTLGVPPVPKHSIGGNKSCGERKIRMGRIASGSIVQPIGKWPWMAMLQRKNNDNNFEQYCGGTLLANKWIITAAHCVSDVLANHHLRIRLGTHKRNGVGSNTQEIGVKGIYVHPEYSTHTKYNNDIALLELERPAMLNNYVESVCLPKDRVLPGAKCIITGWGKQWADSTRYPEKLLEADVQIQKYDECKRQYGDKLTSNMVCANGHNNYADTCPGDSGGPLMCQNQDGSWSLTGITSWGHKAGCGTGYYYGVYTNIEQVNQWIQQTTFKPHLASKLH